MDEDDEDDDEGDDEDEDEDDATGDSKKEAPLASRDCRDDRAVELGVVLTVRVGAAAAGTAVRRNMITSRGCFFAGGAHGEIDSPAFVVVFRFGSAELQS